MPDALPLGLLLLAAFVALVGLAAWSDIRRLVIPNAIPLALVLIWPAFAAATGIGLWSGLATGALVLAIGAGLFAAGLVGGGDAKLMAACALWAGPTLVLPFILVTLLGGGALGMAEWLRLGRKRRLEARYGPVATSRTAPAQAGTAVVPYAVAIAGGALWVAVATAVALIARMN
ncbi:MAG: prepilin peptidase [Alphaproteobacteria bacterium]